MRRKKLVILELFIVISISICVISIIFSLYFICSNLGRTILNVNNSNREKIKEMFRESENYKEIYNIDDVKKIQFFLAFNDLEFTLYYKNGEEKVIYDDDLYELREYIKEKGYSKAGYYVAIDAIIILICIGLNKTRKKLSDKIDLLDKQEE